MWGVVHGIDIKNYRPEAKIFDGEHRTRGYILSIEEETSSYRRDSLSLFYLHLSLFSAKVIERDRHSKEREREISSPSSSRSFLFLCVCLPPTRLGRGVRSLSSGKWVEAANRKKSIYSHETHTYIQGTHKRADRPLHPSAATEVISNLQVKSTFSNPLSAFMDVITFALFDSLCWETSCTKHHSQICLKRDKTFYHPQYSQWKIKKKVSFLGKQRLKYRLKMAGAGWEERRTNITEKKVKGREEPLMNHLFWLFPN